MSELNLGNGTVAQRGWTSAMLLIGAIIGGSSACDQAGTDSSADPTLQTGRGGHHQQGATDPRQLVGDRRIPFAPPNDVGFIDFFIPHHQMAIRMAEVEIARGAREEVRTLARRMKDDQAAEIQVMREARLALTGRPDPEPAPPDPHMEADISAMQSASGTEVDRMFLQHMIPHHGGALPVAHRADRRMEREDIHFFSQHFFDEQANDIGMMKRLLGTPAACPIGGGPPDCTTAADLAVAGDRRIPFTPADDVAFIDFFVAHHRMAIEMAEMEVARGSRPEVKALAERVIAAQTEEIARMRAIRQELTGTAETRDPPEDPHAALDRALMERLSFGALDDFFLHDMIQHHAAGLAPAHRSEPRLYREDLREIARAIFNAQSNEIGEMQALRFDADP